MKKLMFVFSGQGSQYSGMGKTLVAESKVAARVFDEASEALRQDMRKLCWESNLEELTLTQNAQPALLTLSVAQFQSLKFEHGVEPHLLAGHSLGEISALTCAGAIALLDAVRLVRKRGEFMQEAVAHGLGAMTAVSGVRPDLVEEKCRSRSRVDRVASVSCYNTSDQCVVSGHAEAVREVEEELVLLGARTSNLKVSAPFHCSLMANAAEKLRAEMSLLSFKNPIFPVVANVNAEAYPGAFACADLLTQQMTKPVRWEQSMVSVVEQGVTHLLELGAGSALKNMMKKIAPQVSSFSWDNSQDRVAFKTRWRPSMHSDHSAPIIPQDLFKVLTRSLAIAVCTKNSNWDNEEYQRGVVEPYRKVEELVEEIEKAGRETTAEEARKGLDMLKSVFLTKKTDPKEQRERYEQIFRETGTRNLFEQYFI